MNDGGEKEMEVRVKKGKLSDSDLLFIVKFNKSEIDQDLTWCPTLKQLDLIKRVERMIVSRQGKSFPDHQKVSEEHQFLGKSLFWEISQFKFGILRVNYDTRNHLHNVYRRINYNRR